MGRGGTRSTWPDETPEEVIERTRREHGDEMADIVAKAMGMEPSRKKGSPSE